jgi:hypothetical protein
MRLTVFGDFNCPYSYHRVDWYAVEHDPRPPVTGQPRRSRVGVRPPVPGRRAVEPAATVGARR